MKYISKNKTQDFVFHDSVFELESYSNGILCVTAKYLNIHKDAEENPHNYDMEIKEAKITFKGFRPKSFKKSGKSERNENGAWITTEYIVLENEEADADFTKEIAHGITVYYFDRHDGNEYYVDACGIEPFFTMLFYCDDIIIEWDEFRKKAWYELHRQYKYDITLATPDGELKTNLHITYHEEDVYFEGKLEKGPTVNAGIKYNGKEIWGHGKDYLWVDAFADLQKQLPESVTLKCCLTCRHGNMCPFGNKPGEVFCTKGMVISSKNDVCNLFNQEIEKLSRNYADYCEDYQHQSSEFYTYNNYLYMLDK